MRNCIQLSYGVRILHCGTAVITTSGECFRVGSHVGLGLRLSAINFFIHLRHKIQ